MRLPKDVEARVLALAGGPAKPRRRAAPPKKLAAGWAVELSLPCVVRSELNQRDHWAVRKRRFDTQATTLRAVLLEAGLESWLTPFPLTATFTHVGRAMDDDNLAGAFKGLRDSLAKWLGVDDADPLVSWRYEQQAGTPGVRVRIGGRA
jgi:hypothetical protein